MPNKTYPCLWFDGQAKAAAEFYCSVFPDSKITIDTPMVVNWELNGLKFMGLNGGPMFKLNASISLFANFDSVEELNTAWNKLIDGGSALMNIDKYPWSERYGWLKDKFGMTWQLMLSNNNHIVPSMLFANAQYGNGKAAMEFYSSLFPNSGINVAQLYGEQDQQSAGNLMFGEFHILGQTIVAMDGPGDHDFTFNEALSFVVECADQAELDKYWYGLVENGGSESMCGWLKDKFGVSWQIIPASIGKLMSDPVTGNKVMQEVLKMRKLDIAIMEKAAAQ